MEESSVGSEGWSLEGGILDTAKVGSVKVSTVTVETSGDATNGCGDWIRATLGVAACALVIPW